MKTYLIGCTHFGDEKILSYLDDNGKQLRPFTSLTEMENTLINNYNSTVQDEDTCYFVGDIAANLEGLELINELNGTKVLVAGNHDCLSINTQCLTNKGWLDYTEITKDHLVLSLDSLGQAFWMPIDDIHIKDHCGEIYSYSSNRLQMEITPNHRVMYKDSEGYKYKKACLLQSDRSIKVVRAGTSNHLDYAISDDYLKLLAWCYTDSCLVGRTNSKSITFYQSKIEGINRITTLLKDANKSFKHKVRDIKPKGTICCGKKLINNSLQPHEFYLGVKESADLLELMEYSKNRLCSWMLRLSDRQAKLFVEEIIFTDGSYGSTSLNSAVIHGKKEFLDSLQMLCLSKNIQANLSVARQKDYRLNINFSSQDFVVNFKDSLKRGKWKTILYKGKVWCISTLYTNFMVRTNGQAYFTGNCLKTKAYLRYFQDVKGAVVLPQHKIIIQHYPIHSECLYKGWTNIHAHTHHQSIQDPRYFSVCPEVNGYHPVDLEDIIKTFKQNVPSYI